MFCSPNKILLTFITFCFYLQICVAQSGFKTSFGLSAGEPNYSNRAVLHSNNFYISGTHFDTTRTIWNNFVGKFDKKGGFRKLIFFDEYPLPWHHRNNLTFQDEKSFYFLNSLYDTIRIMRFDFETDSLFVDRKINRRDFDMSVTSYLLDDNFKTTYIAGITIEDERNSSIIRITETDTVVYKEVFNGYEEKIFNLRFNSKGQILAVERQNRVDSLGVSILILDKNLVPLNQDRKFFFNFNIRDGMLVDSKDNILVTGVKIHSLGVYSGKEGILKFNDQGIFLWWKPLGNNITNYWVQARWQSLVETHEKDGYIVAGAEGYDTFNQDTLFTQAAVAKISEAGDSIWMKRFSFRSYHHVLLEIFHDVIQTDDGGYFLTGETIFPNGTSDPETPWTKSLLVKINKDGEIDTTINNVISLDLGNNINVYPNPTYDRIFFSQTTQSPLEVRIFDGIGNEVDRFKTSGSENITVINTSVFSAGHYFIIAKNESGTTYRSKFIVVR